MRRYLSGNANGAQPRVSCSISLFYNNVTLPAPIPYMYISLLYSSSTRAKSIFMIPPSCNTNGFITISSLLLNLHLLLNPSLLFSAPLPQEVRNRKGTESNINWVIEKRSHHFDSIHRPMYSLCHFHLHHHHTTMVIIKIPNINSNRRQKRSLTWSCAFVQ